MVRANEGHEETYGKVVIDPGKVSDLPELTLTTFPIVDLLAGSYQEFTEKVWSKPQCGCFIFSSCWQYGEQRSLCSVESHPEFWQEMVRQRPDPVICLWIRLEEADCRKYG